MNAIGRLLGFMIILFLFSGCAAPPAKKRYVWPLPPDEPRIEYLGVYNNQKDIEVDNFLTTYVTGRDESPFFLQNPQMAAGDGQGRVFVTDLKLGGVFVFDFNSKNVTLLGGEGVGLLGQPTGVAFDGDGFLYVADSAKRKIMVFTRELRPYGVLDLSSLKSIGFIAIDKPRKRILVPDPKDSKVHIVDYKGVIISTITNLGNPDGGFNRPNAVAVAPDGTIFVADTLNARVVQFTPDGSYLSNFGVRGDNPGQFNIIQGIAVDSSGNIYVTDARSNRFNILNAKGELLLAVGTAGDSRQNIGVFQIPFGISIDQNDTIYIVEKYFSRFQKYQFFTDSYRAKTPILVDTLAKPVVEENKSNANKVPPPVQK